MEKNDYKKMEQSALSSNLESLKKELSKLNLQIATGSKLENPGNVRKIKRQIARIYTELTNKKIANKLQGGAIKSK